MMYTKIMDDIMRAVRIFLLVLIVIGIGLIVTQNIWVPKLVDRILEFEGIPAQYL